MQAASRGYTHIVQQFFQDKHIANAVIKEQQTALHVAAAFGYTDVVLLLLTSGAKVHAADNKNQTALRLASQSGNE